MLHGDVVDHLHHNDGLTHSCATEHPHLAAARKGNQQVYNLDAGLEHIHARILVLETRSRTVNRVIHIRIDRSQTIHRPANHVKDTPKAWIPDRHADRRTRILGFHPPHQTIGDVHSDATDDIVTKVLGNLHHKIVLGVIDGWVGDEQCRQNGGKFAFNEFNIDNRTYDLYNFALVHG
ncbi:hypothetical protein TRIP_B200557 [uncultured Desulfatiglans sp.]|nr:hypothetical protein TRIP_B200557 [uncultured Desulfatiglans sp.]